MKIAVSILCENPRHKTGLSTMFPRFVAAGLAQFKQVSWLIFAGPDQEWPVTDSRVTVDRRFPANDRLRARLLADHFWAPAAARRQGADAMLSTGFVPARKLLPTALQVFSLQHLNPANRVGRARRLYRKLVTARTWPRADLVIVNSQCARDHLLAIYPEFAARTIVSHEGLQHDIFQPRAGADEPARLARQFGLMPGYLLSIANFYPYKQLDRLVAAYARLASEFRREHPLVLAGADWENNQAAVRALAGRLGVLPDVRFLGWIGDEWLAPLYRQAALFCQASREETFGRSVLESMACGTPVVAHDIPVVREVTAGQAALVDFTQADAAAETLRRLVDDRARHAALRDGGLRRAADFSFERLAGERIDAICEMVGARKTAA